MSDLEDGIDSPEMETPPSDRLANLFLHGTLPSKGLSTPSNNSQPDRTMELPQSPTNWKIPDVAEYPRQVHGGRPKPASGTDLLTSSEEDDYISAFASKPKMKSKNMKRHRTRQPKQTTELDASTGIRTKATKPTESVLGDMPACEDSGEQQDCFTPTSQHLSDFDQQGNPSTGHFCQFNLVAKFPYKYLEDSNDRVSRHFFANNKFFEREWDLYYLYPPSSIDGRPLLLLPYDQVKSLIEQISHIFKTALAVPPFPFTLSFFDDGTPQPTKLGTTNSRADINNLQDSIPPIPENHGAPPTDASPKLRSAFANFKTRCESALAGSKRKSAAARRRKVQSHLVIQRGHTQLLQAQRYLGLLPPAKLPEQDPDLSWSEQETLIKEAKERHSVVLDPFSVNQAAPFVFEDEHVIISLDVESYERNHSIITEIGISTLDTLDLVRLAPGESGDNWTRQIRSRHFRISGREHYVNKDFCIGDPNSFQFGKSEFVNIERAGFAVDQCFQWPFSVQFKHDGKLDLQSRSWEDILKEAMTEAEADATVKSETTVDKVTSPFESNSASVTSSDSVVSDTHEPGGLMQRGGKERNIILVGHDVKADLTYLSQLSSTVFSHPSLANSCSSTLSIPAVAVEKSSSHDSTDKEQKILSTIRDVFDTAILYRILKKESQPRSLTSVLVDLGKQCRCMHNAGNDARYTLEAFIAMTVRARHLNDETARAAETARQEAEQESVVTNQRWCGQAEDTA